MVNRLKEKYDKEIVPSLMEKFNYSSIMQAPKVEKIVLNMGVGDAVSNAKNLDEAVDELTLIAGQKPVITRAKKSIAGFRLREGMAIGAKVTLRGQRMYEFLDKLVSVSLPRVRDFHGVSKRAFDGRGNYTLGVKEQLIFPEIDFDNVNKVRGLDIVIVTTANTDEESRELLTQLGMPFAKKSQIAKNKRPAKFSTQEYSRCERCGRPHSVYRKFKLCRVCLRDLAHKGQIPGMKKASW